MLFLKIYHVSTKRAWIPSQGGVLKNPGYVVLGLGHAKGVCVTRHLTPYRTMVAGHIRLGRQDLPQHTNCTFSTRPQVGNDKK